MSALSMVDVVEEHRVSVGAERVHLSLGPQATPEKVRDELARVRTQMEAYEAIPEETRLRARICWLEERIAMLGALAQTDVSEALGESLPMRNLKRQIFSLTDMLPLDLEYAHEFHEAEQAGVPGTKWSARRRLAQRTLSRKAAASTDDAG